MYKVEGEVMFEYKTLSFDEHDQVMFEYDSKDPSVLNLTSRPETNYEEKLSYEDLKKLQKFIYEICCKMEQAGVVVKKTVGGAK